MRRFVFIELIFMELHIAFFIEILDAELMKLYNIICESVQFESIFLYKYGLEFDYSFFILHLYRIV